MTVLPELYLIACINVIFYCLLLKNSVGVKSQSCFHYYCDRHHFRIIVLVLKIKIAVILNETDITYKVLFGAVS